METRKVSEIIWRDDLYPRIETDPILVQKYAQNLEVLPPIEINQHNQIIDGWHRWTAHRKNEVEEIPVIITQTNSDVEFLSLAIKRNSTHGQQMNNKDKRSMAIRLYNSGVGLSKEAIAETLSVTKRSVSNYLSDIDRQLREERQAKILEMWLACYTQEQIAEASDLKQGGNLSNILKDLDKLENFPKGLNLSALYQDDFKPELFDIWTFAKKTNEVSHFGNTEVRIVDNLLYTFTEPFDIVIDPFAGGGSTIDICKKRLRRFWVSDRKPIVEREDEIREHDLLNGVSGPYQWGDVALVYLDPPYWKQAAGKYSDDKEDLANMSLDDFTNNLTNIISQYGSKLKQGSHIACIISPTQWPNEDKATNYHDIDLACKKFDNLRLVRRVICPYSTQQYNGTQVQIAKDEKLWLVLSRTMLVWEKI